MVGRYSRLSGVPSVITDIAKWHDHVILYHSWRVVMYIMGLLALCSCIRNRFIGERFGIFTLILAHAPIHAGFFYSYTYSHTYSALSVLSPHLSPSLTAACMNRRVCLHEKMPKIHGLIPAYSSCKEKGDIHRDLHCRKWTLLLK